MSYFSPSHSSISGDRRNIKQVPIKDTGKRQFLWEKKKKRNTHIPKTQVSKSLSSLIGVTMKSSLYKFSSVAKSCIWLFATPWTAAGQASLFITMSRSPTKAMSIESVMPSNHLILYRPLLLLPSIFPSVRVFPMSQLFAWGSQSIGVSASTSVLPMNTQD